MVLVAVVSLVSFVGHQQQRDVIVYRRDVEKSLIPQYVVRALSDPHLLLSKVRGAETP